MRTAAELERIYGRQCKTVWNICFPYFMNGHDTADAVQETFLRLMMTSKEFCDENQEKAWLITTARNVCKDELKKARRKNVPLESAKSVSETPKETDDTLAAVQALPEKYRTVIYLYYYEDCSVEEISKMLNRRANTVRSDLHRARIMLKERLKGDEHNER